MKKEIHPDNYRLVVFMDTNSGFKFLTRSTAQTTETIKWEDGNEYPLVKVHISSASHPFYTGEEKIVDVEGRVDRFKARQKAAQERLKSRTNKQSKKPSESTKAKKDKETVKIGGGNQSDKPKAKNSKQKSQK